MYIGLLKKGDEVINVTSEFVCIKHKKGEVDIVPLLKYGESVRVDIENIVTIGYGDNTVKYVDENGTEVINF